ncbi:extracellular solute-binding protein [Paenibacillus tianjinensis]|uniref:Extracellular solute-binding protein n=1 Tax=Paenibacillus tianjinensis TaxID=2810347 RepID=A0ABX7L7X9_9BACL|nr:extracellular solute-binding protein [Paenibacillus tianjinensis]QSF43971.1 extracellular solute-binding protein [Paenibacillus tianjinensis]
MKIRLSLLILLLTLSGCNFQSTGESLPAASQESLTPHFEVSEGKYIPPVDLYTVGSVNPNLTFKKGESLEHNVHTTWAEERLGIRIRYLWTISGTSETYANKLRLELAKGNMPDVVTTRDADIIQELIKSGQFMEVGSLFEKYASAVWKKAVAEDPSAWDPFVQDGHKYAIPIMDYEYNSDPLLWIRQDWLDKLNLAAPRTLDELERVMDAFVNRDPDGNGLKDTYGLAVGFRNGANTWMGDSSWIFGAFGTVPEQWNRRSDGTLEYGSVLPGARKAVALMKHWVGQGYLSADSAWLDEEGAANLFVSGKAGIIAGPYWMRGWPLSYLTDTDPKARVQAVAIPSGPDGTAMRRGTLPVNGAILINKKMKHPEIFFTYQNYLFDSYATSTGEFINGLAEGYDWAMVDGNPTIMPSALPMGGIRVASYTLTFDGARIPSKVIKEIPEDIAPVLLGQKEASRKEQFTGPPTVTMKSAGELLKKLEQKSYQKIIFADSGIGEFDEFVGKWKAYGGLTETSEVNAWDRSRH